MLRNLIRAFLVFRLESIQLSVDPALVLLAWRQRPAIQMVLFDRREKGRKRAELHRKLDEVYPF